MERKGKEGPGKLAQRGEGGGRGWGVGRRHRGALPTNFPPRHVLVRYRRPEIPSGRHGIWAGLVTFARMGGWGRGLRSDVHFTPALCWLGLPWRGVARRSSLSLCLAFLEGTAPR